jgi:hypothetical protein
MHNEAMRLTWTIAPSKAREPAMKAPATIPVKVSPEAATRIEALGMSKEFEMMIEHIKLKVADLHSILVTRFDDPEVRRYFSFPMRFRENHEG